MRNSSKNTLNSTVSCMIMKCCSGDNYPKKDSNWQRERESYSMQDLDYLLNAEGNIMSFERYESVFVLNNQEKVE